MFLKTAEVCLSCLWLSCFFEFFVGNQFWQKNSQMSKPLRFEKKIACQVINFLSFWKAKQNNLPYSWNQTISSFKMTSFQNFFTRKKFFSFSDWGKISWDGKKSGHFAWNEWQDFFFRLSSPKITRMLSSKKFLKTTLLIVSWFCNFSLSLV